MHSTVDHSGERMELEPAGKFDFTVSVQSLAEQLRAWGEHRDLCH